MSGPIEFTTLGTPAPKGSSRAMVRGGKPTLVPSGSSANKHRLQDWKSSLRAAATAAVGRVEDPPFPADVALKVMIAFRLARPAGHRSKKTGALLKSAPARPTKKPDFDKLVRSTLDAMTGVVYADDSQICEAVIRKRYALPGEEGAWIRVEALREGQS